VGRVWDYAPKAAAAPSVHSGKALRRCVAHSQHIGTKAKTPSYPEAKTPRPKPQAPAPPDAPWGQRTSMGSPPLQPSPCPWKLAQLSSDWRDSITSMPPPLRIFSRSASIVSVACAQQLPQYWSGWCWFHEGVHMELRPVEHQEKCWGSCTAAMGQPPQGVS
jgi:hypothetical protein